MNYSNILENKLPDILEQQLNISKIYHNDYDWVITGGSVANIAINYLFNENLPINDIDVYVFNGNGDQSLNMNDMQSATHDSYNAFTTFEFMDFAIGPIKRWNNIEEIPISFSLIGKVDFDDVIVPYFLHTHPLNCTKIAYNPKTRQVTFTKDFIEFLHHRRILFNPISSDFDIALFSGLRKHEQGVGTLSSDYVRAIFSGKRIYEPISPKYKAYFVKLQQYPFVQTTASKVSLWLNYPKHPLVVAGLNIHARVAYLNEAMYYDDTTKKQIQNMLVDSQTHFYTIASLVDPAYFRKGISAQQVKRFKYLDPQLDYYIPNLLLANNIGDMLTFLNSLRDMDSNYLHFIIAPLLITNIRYGIKDVFEMAEKVYNRPRTLSKIKNLIKTIKELADITTDSNFWDMFVEDRKSMYGVNKVLYTPDYLYTPNTSLGLFLKIVKPK